MKNIMTISDDFIAVLESEFKKNANEKIAEGQKAYMKNKFEFYGIKSPDRHKIQNPFLVKNFLPPKENLEKIVKKLWNKPQREFQYFTMELVLKYKKLFDKKDIELFEYMVVNKSWWDSIDFIAPKLISEQFRLFPEQREKYVKKWLASGNIWLQRSAILFQLKYKQETDTDFLSYVINSLLGSDEFFINKAIGWILREYGKTNPAWVVNFAQKTDLHKLSRKEALRLILHK